jgi:PAS domain S-box-containing protein
MLGYKPDEIVGRLHFYDLFAPERKEELKKTALDRFATKESFRGVINTNLHKNGTRIILETSGVPNLDEQGRLMGYRGTDIDITARKRAEDALYMAHKKLNLLSSITRHDILNQLLILKSYLILSQSSKGDLQKMTDLVEKGQHIAEIIEMQISFTREYQNLGVKAPVWQNMEASIGNSMGMLPVRDIRVITEVSDLELYADPLFGKVCYNLVDNSLRYWGPGMTTIRFSATESEQGLTIICEDDGAGIIAEDKARLFFRGYGRNTGLGLFLSREILAITGITITENGEPGKGARFEITVPKGAYRFTGSG